MLLPWALTVISLKNRTALHAPQDMGMIKLLHANCLMPAYYHTLCVNEQMRSYKVTGANRPMRCMKLSKVHLRHDGIANICKGSELL